MRENEGPIRLAAFKTAEFEVIQDLTSKELQENSLVI